MTRDQRNNDPGGADGMRDWTPEEEAVLLEMRKRTTPFDVTERRAVGLTLAEVDEAVGFDLDDVEAAADEIRAELDAYDRTPLDTPDEWGDLATWRTAAGSTTDEDTAP